MNLAQIVSLFIFLAVFIFIIIGKVHRYIPATIGAVLGAIIIYFIILKSAEGLWWVLNLKQISQYHFWVPGEHKIEAYGINWQTIIFLSGMMMMVEGLERSGFFTWICLYTAKLVKYRVIPILLSFMLLSGFLAMFIDSITVLLFTATVSIRLGRLLGFDPVPVIIASIFAANTGGSATISGDPPNVIIGTAFGYTFMDFFTNTGLIAWISMLFSLSFFYFFFRRQLAPKTASNPHPQRYPDPSEAITNPLLFRISAFIFVLVITLIVTHHYTGISLALIGVIATFITLLANITHIPHIIKRFDWRTIVFLISLFACVGALEWTGVLAMVSDRIGEFSGGSIFLVIPSILWLSAYASAIVDNIPFAATMVPVIRELSISQGFPLPTLAWTLALGTDIGGNATPIGASANVVGTAIADREGYRIGWGRYCKYAIPATILVILLCNIYLWARYT